ncbi:C40 family peptidase [Streptomyces sp. NPDC006798]|uniref:C40 family peptidase n=1 Tax=Streptomyces sp. NPDC006798 TaxID=3155462 RepID=UPI0033D13F52
MSHTAHIPSHRKPRRRSASNIALRAGVAGGVLSTVAVAGAAGPASADPVTETIEMPAFDAASSISHVVAQSAANSQQVALDQKLQDTENASAAKASTSAKKAKAEALRKAEAARAEAKKRAADRERAARDAARTTLASAKSAAKAPKSSSSASGSVATVINFLKAQVGDAYVMGATGPNSWDCSSLVRAAFRQVNIELPRVSQDQSRAGVEVGTSNLKVGDILYWGAKGNAYHTGVYIGDGKYLDAANSRKGVVIQDLSGYPATGAVRVL